MGFLTPDEKDDEEQPGPGAGLSLDLEVKACPSCRRDLPPWQGTCPDCRVPAVRRAELPPDERGLALRPEDVLANLADADPDDPDPGATGS